MPSMDLRGFVPPHSECACTENENMNKGSKTDSDYRSNTSQNDLDLNADDIRRHDYIDVLFVCCCFTP